MIDIGINNDAGFDLGDTRRLKKAIKAILKDHSVTHGEISLAIVDDEQMHRLNNQYLQHDYTTDVLSFVLEEGEGWVDGELIVCFPYAAREAERFGWPASDEVLLYTIHGTLHLVGHDDQDPDSKKEMRAAEREYLALFGLTPTYDAEE